MPKKGEKSRKLTQLRKGHGVKPPRRWFKKIYRKVSKEYPQAGKKRLGRIVGGIWAKLKKSSKEGIVRKYQK